MKHAAFLVSVLLLATGTVKGDLIQWHDTSLSLLHGNGYEVDAEDQTTLTFEYANGHRFGDLFMFYDYTAFHSSPQEDSPYGELSTRFSVGKIVGKDLSLGIFEDLLLSTTYEFGKGDVESLLYGLAVDLRLPGFDFFQLNLYKRDPANNESDGWQLTTVWRTAFPVGNSELVVDGFVDWVFESENDNYEENVHLNSQIKYDIGMALWGEARKGRLYTGIECDVWNNKYGIPERAPFEADQETFSWLIKVHF